MPWFVLREAPARSRRAAVSRFKVSREVGLFIGVDVPGHFRSVNRALCGPVDYACILEGMPLRSGKALRTGLAADRLLGPLGIIVRDPFRIGFRFLQIMLGTGSRLWPRKMREIDI
jgi:hypothetical protein